MKSVLGLVGLAMALGVSGEGINCHGSSNCANVAFKLSDLRSTMDGIDNDRWYQNGEHIACWENLGGSGFCAFLQGTGGIPGNEIKDRMQDLVNHGCAKCGSVPVYYPEDNDINSHGELTVNFVSKTNCNGVC